MNESRVKGGVGYPNKREDYWKNEFCHWEMYILLQYLEAHTLPDWEESHLKYGHVRQPWSEGVEWESGTEEYHAINAVGILQLII